MTARCASCCYPLTISDSVNCYECKSYFHIDCAQLVGFPYYELSCEPHRNTFYCTTCELLPLPRRAYDSDSDSDCDYTMPSRQLDYHLEGQTDFAKDMNEVKGSVQDLSDLCKDMLREINELKSINLTLRCCVENLKHDNENRDKIIGDLKRRLEIFEKNVEKTNLDETTHWEEEGLYLEREEDVERYLTPEPEFDKITELDSSLPDDISNSNTTYGMECSNKPLSTDYSLQDKVENEHWGGDDDTLDSAELNESEEKRLLENDYEEQEYSREFESLHTDDVTDSPKEQDDDSYFGIKAETISENAECIKNWTWKGSDAIEVGKMQTGNISEEEEESESEESENAGTESQEWEVLSEDKTAEQEKEYILKSPGILHESQESEGEDNDISNTDQTHYWADRQGRSKRSVEDVWPTRENENYTTRGEEKHGEDEEMDVGGSSIENEDQGRLFLSEARTDDGTRASEIRTFEEMQEVDKLLEDTPHENGSVQGDELLLEEELLPDDSATAVEGTEGTAVEEPAKQRLEGEEALDGEIVPEGAHLSGRQTPVSTELPTEGDVQLSGPSVGEGEEQSILPPEGETNEPELPPSPEPEHTEEDLWMYLKETVSSAHPSTVEEFLENLIGTLQHVPEDYLKPVIDANIKRATSPSITDGEHLPSPDGVNLEGKITPIGGETTLEEVDPSAGKTEGSPAVEEGFPAPEGGPQESAEADEGYAAVEAAA